MPIIKESGYSKRPSLYFNAWMETLVPYFTRKKNQVSYERERLELKDGDFLDLDWVKNGSNCLFVISHGFEGDSKDHFIEELAVHYKEADLLVWHYRSCSGELNRLPRFYDQGDIQDVDAVINHGRKLGNYEQIFLVGFSMGGNLVINYLGSDIEHGVKGGVVFSAPMDLAAASQKLQQGANRWIEKSFVRKFKKKIERKAEVFPTLFDLEKLENVNSLEELLAGFVLPHSGYPSTPEFYKKWSSRQFIPKIDTPLLIVNAKNDPLLTKHCYPVDLCEKSETVFLEVPRYGGHMGFSSPKEGKPWFVHRIVSFFNEESNMSF